MSNADSSGHFFSDNIFSHGYLGKVHLRGLELAPALSTTLLPQHRSGTRGWGIVYFYHCACVSPPAHRPSTTQKNRTAWPTSQRAACYAQESQKGLKTPKTPIPFGNGHEREREPSEGSTVVVSMEISTRIPHCAICLSFLRVTSCIDETLVYSHNYLT